MSDRLFHPENTRYDKYNKELPKPEVMQNQVMTKSGEIVEIVGAGVLICKNKLDNWKTISEWIETVREDWDFKCEIRVEDTNIFFEFPESVPTHRLLSLLEHFNHQ